MDNLQRSEKVISLVLNHLIEQGFQKFILQNESVDLDDELQPFFAESIRWLLSEGIIQASNVSETLDGTIAVVSPKITAYGFSLLDQRIAFGGEEKKLGTAVQEVSKSGTSYSAIGDFVGGILGGLTKSLGS